MINVLIAPNAFKETADPVEVSKIIDECLRESADIKTTVKPISDGGDGFLQAAINRLNLRLHYFNVTRSYNSNFLKVPTGYDEENSNLYIESADILGMKVVPTDKRNIMVNNSKGLGDLLLQLVRKEGSLKTEKVTVGVGGTATNDLGLGALSRLGLSLYDKDMLPLPVIPFLYKEAEYIKAPDIELPFQLEFIIDVNNPLTGAMGAANIFARQKGADEAEISELEAGFENILRIAKKANIKFDDSALSGAGGGLAAGFQIFYGSRIKYSNVFIKEEVGTGGEQGKGYDYVITGEGAFDRQSLMNKGTGVIIDIFKEKVNKIFVICGSMEESLIKRLPENVQAMELSAYFENKEESMNNVEKGIKIACKEILTLLKS